jgi:hypothetical protein
VLLTLAGPVAPLLLLLLLLLVVLLLLGWHLPRPCRQ